MKPEYIGIGNFDTMNYVYAYCKCPLPTDYAIKWPLIKDGKPHSYTCICEDCGTEVGVYSKSFGPEVYKEKSEDVISREAVLEAWGEIKKEIEHKKFRTMEVQISDAHLGFNSGLECALAIIDRYLREVEE